MRLFLFFWYARNSDEESRTIVVTAADNDSAIGKLDTLDRDFDLSRELAGDSIFFDSRDPLSSDADQFRQVQRNNEIALTRENSREQARAALKRAGKL